MKNNKFLSGSVVAGSVLDDNIKSSRRNNKT